MRVREYIRDVVDGAEPHFVLVQPRAQFVQCMFGDFVPDDGIERLPVRDALGVGQEARVGDQVGPPQGAAEALVDALGGRCNRCPLVIASSEERRVGKEWVSTCRSRWSPYN